MTNSIKKGIFLSVLTAVISGFSIFYNKLVIVKGVDPLILNIVKNGGVALVLSFLLITGNKIPSVKNLSSNQWKKLLLIGIIGGAIPFILFFEGLKLVPAINANIIQKSLTFWIAIIAIPILKEKISKIQVVGLILILLSNFFIGGFRGFSFSRGEFLILLAAIFWSLEYIISKITLKNTESIIVAWGRMFIGSIFLMLFAISQNKIYLLVQLNLNQVISISGSIIFLSAYCINLYKALKLAPVTLIASILLLSTPITNILTAVFITKSLNTIDPANLFLTFLGIILIIFIPKRKLILLPSK